MPEKVSFSFCLYVIFCDREGEIQSLRGDDCEPIMMTGVEGKRKEELETSNSELSMVFELLILEYWD